MADMESDLETCGSTGLRVGFKCSIKAIYFVHQNPRVSAPVSWLNITRNAVIALYVLLECLKWISMLFKLSNKAYPYSIDRLSLVSKTEAIA